MLLPKTRWVVDQTNEDARALLMDTLNLSPLVAALLANRGITDPAEAELFLHCERQDFHDPFMMEGMEKAVDRIKKAAASGETILVYGDYDADGVTSTSIMMTVLRDLGANASYYIPNRFTEGYGPNEAAFRKAHEAGVSLIITVDTGISALHEAEVAKELGMDLIITDHHEPRPELPDAFAIVHPNLPGTGYPFHYLAGAGTAFKLAHALYGEVPEALLDLAAIGTIADLVPLKGENRLIASRGLKRLTQTDRPGLRALCQISGVSPAEATEETVGFAIGPRLNAAGRLDHAGPAVELLLAEDSEQARMLADEIDGMNKERQAIVADISKEAIRIVEENFPLETNSVLVVGQEGWNPGVIGIVASRLVERFYRPAIVLSFDRETGMAKGSARSIPGFDLFKNLSACADLLPHYGGHTMAAGMTLAIDDVDELRDRLNRAAEEQLEEKDFIPVTRLDAEVDLGDISLSSIAELGKLAPYGMDNPKPVIKIDKVKTKDIRKIGSSHNHLKMMLDNGEAQLDAIGFQLGHLADGISPVSEVSVIGELSINEWNQMRKPQIFLKDVAVSEWQLFDFRGHRQPKQWLPLLPDNNLLFVFFRAENARLPFPMPKGAETLLAENAEAAKAAILDGKHIVLYDLPENLAQVENLIGGKSPARIYLHLAHEREQFFSQLPTREHFKWYYAFLLKRKTFDVSKHGKDLAAYRGWPSDTISFMSKVFFELGFVTMNDGVLSIQPGKMKKDLSEAPAYKKKQAEIEVENKLLLSSFQQAKQWFDERVANPVLHEEETKAWT